MGKYLEKEFLKEYRSKKEEITELKILIRNLKEDEGLVGNSVIMDYQTGYPRPQTVVGTDHEKYWNIREEYMNKISLLEEECRQAERYVEEIKDSRTRRIFRMYCIEGKSQEEVGRILHLDRSRISKIMDNYIKKAHKTHESHL